MSILLSPTGLAVMGLLLLSWATSGRKRYPLIALPALGLVGFAMVTRLLSGGGIVGLAAGLMGDIGLALIVASVAYAARGGKLKVYLVPGLLALLLSVALHGMKSMLDPTASTPDTSVTDTSPNTPTLLDREPGQLLLELGPDDAIGELQSVLDRFDVRYERAFPNLQLTDDEDLAQYFILYGNDDVLDELMVELRADTENVDQVDWNPIVRLSPPDMTAESLSDTEGTYLENDPLVGRQWGLDFINAHELHEMLVDAEPAEQAVVAIVDTGVDDTHEDMRGVFGDSPGRGDGNGHGSHCAGLAGAATNNGVGIASLNWDNRFVQIRSYKALGNNGAGTAETVAQAIIDAARGGADVISLSLGSWSPIPPKVEVDAVEYALQQGAIVLAAAGNSNDDAKEHAPSNIEGVITVAALDQNGRKASFSNTNTSLKRPIAAPGVNMLSLKPGGGYVALNGTSMATPVVAGTVGLMRALNPDLTAAEAYTFLHETGVSGPDNRRVGRSLNAAGAVKAMMDVDS